MQLNPFLNVNNDGDIFSFFEKYSEKTKPFLTIKTNYGLSYILSNEKLNLLVSEKLRYPFLVSDEKKYFWKTLQENVELCSPLVNKIMLSKIILSKIQKVDIQLINKSHLNLKNLRNALESNSESQEKILIVIKDKEYSLDNIINTKDKGALLTFEVTKGKLTTVGPMIELYPGTNILSKYSMQKEIEHVIDRQKDYWDRPLEEIILDASIASIIDLFSDYITEASPFMYRKVILSDEKVYICESFDRV